MAETIKGGADIENIAGRAIIVVVSFSILIAVLSAIVFDAIANNSYTAIYYTLDVMFDATGINAAQAVASGVILFSKNFDIVVIVSIIDGLMKIAIIGFIIAAFINFITGRSLKSRVAVFTAKRLKDHVIICGYTPLAERIASELRKHNRPFVIIEQDQKLVDELREVGYTVIDGDFTKHAALIRASIERAKSIVFVTESDYLNMMGMLAARHLNPKVRMITRSMDEAAVNKMHRAGADMCVVPEIVAGLEIGSKVVG